MPFKDPEKRREAVRKSCRKAYWSAPEKGRAKGRAKHAANRERNNESQRLSRAADPVRFSAYQKKWKAANPEVTARYRRASMLKKHGLTIADYNRMHAEQRGLCKICGRPETSLKNGKTQLLSVEHCHVTSRVMFEDDPALLRAAALYLEG